MPYRRAVSSRKLRLVTINSEKHVLSFATSITSTITVQLVAKAVTAPSNTIATDCHRGGQIKAIWVSADVCGLNASGVNTRIAFYLIKNPGDNLTEPGTFSVGTSNEKKFVIKQWHAMLMRNQDGNPPYHWEGWIKIPKRYQRMGTDDTWQIVTGMSSGTGHGAFQFIYKEYF